ncbi:MAG: hypothetical protein COV55_02950 [Candidatus Komeilibacteria bacterium CG11_big_fil_rev_8_21_14_0_20_36_20]|uniref:Uncharacterized protein n=1 Tax=Candidatus Komeilibacteria bacterium CG11_big_fil_rev_8_21_14_0_20_36_20 TaxID=1974477 RepID=A0A2H0NCR9_9BACT|nr:MAG: hypothetical protein COV55_02950 [Candidatus Komeilibacteria bacterium CG11_big_fil_rev_8_21_14_0_20_36_20]
MTDLRRIRKNYEKKVISVSSANVKHTDVDSTASNELFELPANCLIIEAGVQRVVAGQANLTVDFGFDGGNELGDGLALNGTGYIQDPQAGTIDALTLTEGAPNTLASGTTTLTKAPRIPTGTGKTVTAKFSADPSAGEFEFICVYIEFGKNNGEYTDFGA